MENAIGDFVVTVDPLVDDINFLPEMLERAAQGVDVVFASNRYLPKQKWSYRLASSFFYGLYRWTSGTRAATGPTQYRLISRKVVNYVLQHAQPAVAYQFLPTSSGFSHQYLSYSMQPSFESQKNLASSIDRGLRLLVSSTRAPMRLVTILALFGAGCNLLYSVYIVVVALVKQNVQPGWVSLSLQQSGMFFLVMLVLLVLGEYLLHTADLSSAAPVYHLAQEFTSDELSWQQRINVETPGNNRSSS